MGGAPVTSSQVLWWRMGVGVEEFSEGEREKSVCQSVQSVID